MNLGSAKSANHCMNIFEVYRVRRPGSFVALLTSVSPEQL